MYALIVIASGIAAYLLGSINFAVIMSSAFLKKDVREMGSGNAGTTNVMRNAGFLPGALTFIGDVLKGLASSLIGKFAFGYIYSQTTSAWALPVYGAYFCGLLCIIGHSFPVFFQFRGGKGVATSVGIYGVCSPVAMVFGLSTFAVSLSISKIVSFSSILAAAITVIVSIIFRDDTAALMPQAVMSAIIGLIIVLKHKDNIKRLLNGTESKIGGKKNG